MNHVCCIKKLASEHPIPLLENDVHNMDNDREYDAYDQAEDDALTRLKDSNAMSEEDTDKEEEEKSPRLRHNKRF